MSISHLVLLALSKISLVVAPSVFLSLLSDTINFLILAILFTLHNAEEYLYYDKMPKGFYKKIGKKFDNSKVFLYAISLLSIEVISLAISYYFYNTNKILEVFKNLIIFSIAINSLQHIVGSIIYKRLLPGTLTAIFLMTPFTSYYLITLFEQMKINVLYYIPSAVVFTFGVIYIHLWMGYFIKRLTNCHFHNKDS